jgi:hypothetical protein
MKRLFALIIGLVICLQLLAQQGDNKGSNHYLFTQANLMMHERYTDSALKTFLLIYKTDPDNANVCYYIGQLLLETPAHKADALTYLEKAASKVITKYIPDDPYERSAPPPTYYYFARALHLNYQFSDAIVNFNIFKKLLSKNDARQKDIDYWIQCCNNGTELMKTPVDCKIINIGDSVNSKYPDNSPVISVDEQELIFTSRRPGGMNDSTVKDSNGFYNEDIWMSYARNDGGWTKAKPVNTINTGGNDAAISLSPDGTQLILYRDDGKGGNGSLYASNLKGLQWGYTNTIDSASPGAINSSGMSNPSACLSPDGMTLYFSSNRAGGMGGTDLYKISISDSGKWGQPVNLGPNINTEYDEDAPFIHSDDSTMFFSSKGHNTMGGYDVFMAKLDSGGIWGHVQNMGYPINTPDDDINFSLSADGRRAYYSSIQKGGYGEKDIYEVIFNNPVPVKRVAVLVGYIHTPDNSPLPNDILVSTGQTPVNAKTLIKTKVNPKTGKFLQVLRPNVTYNVVISSQGKDVFNQNFYLPADSSYFTLSRAFFRTGIILGDTSNVFVPKPKIPTTTMDGQVLLNDIPPKPLVNMKIQLVDAKGNVIQTTLTDKNGHFTFEKLPIDQSYLVEVDITDTKLKHLKKLLLANAKGKVVRNFDQSKDDSYFYHDLPADLNNLSEISRIVAIPPKPIRIAASDADYVEFFKYNADQTSQKASNLAALISKISTKLLKDSVTVAIESSASKVPTSAQFAHSNKVLADKRAEDTKKTIINELKKKHAKVIKLKFDVTSSVQGPDYEQDAQDQDKYQRFQYVKVFVR